MLFDFKTRVIKRTEYDSMTNTNTNIVQELVKLILTQLYYK